MKRQTSYDIHREEDNGSLLLMIKHVGFCCAFLLFSASVLSAQTRLDGLLPVSQGDSLELTVYVLVQTPPPVGYPALLFVHGFGLNKDWDTLNCATGRAARADKKNGPHTIISSDG